MNKIIIQATSGPEIVAFIVMAIVGLIIFIALRSFMLWYWKVDEILENQVETNHLLRSIARNLESIDDNRNKRDLSNLKDAIIKEDLTAFVSQDSTNKGVQ